MLPVRRLGRRVQGQTERVPEGTEAPRRRIPRVWLLLWAAFLVYTAFRLVEMTVWLVRAVVGG